jgi:sulfur-carrier protein
LLTVRGAARARPGRSKSVTASAGTATLRYWAAAREAAGTSEEPTAAPDLAAALHDAVARRSERGVALARVLTRCSFLVDSVPVGRRDHASVALPPGTVVEVLPPFAGG